MITVHKTLLLTLAMGMATGWATAHEQPVPEHCWDTRMNVFPFSTLYGALAPEVKRCEGVGSQVMENLKKIRADPTLLDKENQNNHGHGGLYNDLWDCCKEWSGYRCQHIDDENPGGYGSTYLQGYIGPVSGCADALPKGGTGEVIKEAQPPSSEPLPQGGTKKFFKP